MNVTYHVESLSELTLDISFFITTGSRKCVLFFAGGEMAEQRGVMTCLRFYNVTLFYAHAGRVPLPNSSLRVGTIIQLV